MIVSLHLAGTGFYPCEESRVFRHRYRSSRNIAVRVTPIAYHLVYFII